MTAPDPASFFLHFENMGKELEAVEVPPGVRRVVGRSPRADIDIVVPHGTVSGRGPILENMGGRWSVTDLMSTSGLYLNGRCLQPNVPAPITAGDRMRIGGVICMVSSEPTLHLRIAGNLRDWHNLRTTSAASDHVAIRNGERYRLGRGDKTVMYSAGQWTVTGATKSLTPGEHFVGDNVLYFVHEAPPPTGQTTVQDWITLLHSKSRDERWTAAQMLGSLSPELPAVRVALDEAQDDAYEPVRRWAAWAQQRAAETSIYLQLDERRHRSACRIEIPLGKRRWLHGSPGPCRDVWIDEIETWTRPDVQVWNKHGEGYIQDESGRYQMEIHGRSIGTRRTRLTPGDRLRIGGAFFFVHERPPPRSVAPSSQSEV